MARRVIISVLGLIACLGLGGWFYYLWRFPYGHSHCCDLQLSMALRDYALANYGVFPVGKATPQGSLSLLYPKYADANLLRGKVVPIEVIQDLLDRGEPLRPDSCGWHYVEGLTLNDDPGLAIFWDTVGLGHNGQRLGKDDHIVFFVSGGSRYIVGAEWPSFLERQKELLASRDAVARKGGPILVAKIRLPNGEMSDRFDGGFKFETEHRAENTSSTGSSSGPKLVPSCLHWYRNCSNLSEGTTTFVLSFQELRSRPVTIEVKNGRASPSSIVFEMNK